MKILWLTWKDHLHPQAGGAEVVLRELSQRLIADGHQVSFLTVRHKGSAAHEIVDGIDITRVGSNRYTHPILALTHYVKHMRNQYDIVIEVVNTMPYFGTLFNDRARRFVFYHQLAREVWFYEMQSPLSSLGYYVIEPLATRIMSHAKAKLITISQSTLDDLRRFGFRADQAHVISEGIEIPPIENLNSAHKFDRPTMLSLGAMRPMKRTLDQVKAFEIAKRKIPELRLILAGDYSGTYGQQIVQYVCQSPYARDIIFEGRVSFKRKQELMRQSHIVTVTSIKEGWGLIVTEAASQGTPAVAYDVDGLRDSIRHQQTGLRCLPTPENLAEGVIELLRHPDTYNAIREQAWQWSREINFDRSYADFKQALELA